MFATNACTVDVYSDAYQYESYGQSGGDQAGYGSYGEYLNAVCWLYVSVSAIWCVE